jgi:Mrp family chromosome partitioning ATPase
VSASKSDKVGPVLRSLDAVLNHVVARTSKDATRIVLVAPVATATDATAEAIELARALTSKWQPVVLVDLTRGAAAVSGPLGLPRAPGFTDLAAHRAGFENVVHVDTESPLQVIPAGNPAVKASGEEAQGFLRIFEALTQTYECVVLHADADTARKVGRMLDGRQHIVIAVLPAGESGKNGEQRMQEFANPGSQVLGYEQLSGQPRSKRAGLLGRVAAG